MKKWEYKIFQVGLTQIALDDLGQEGWEVVQAIEQAGSRLWAIIVKRPLPSE